MLHISNEVNILGKTFYIRLFQLQNQAWLFNNPLSYQPFKSILASDDWLPLLLSALNKIDIKLVISDSLQNIITGDSMPISDLITLEYRNMLHPSEIALYFMLNNQSIIEVTLYSPIKTSTTFHSLMSNYLKLPNGTHQQKGSYSQMQIGSYH